MSQQGDCALLCTKAVCEAHHGAWKVHRVWLFLILLKIVEPHQISVVTLLQFIDLCIIEEIADVIL